jgi:hypothetical protein
LSGDQFSVRCSSVKVFTDFGSSHCGSLVILATPRAMTCSALAFLPGGPKFTSNYSPCILSSYTRCTSATAPLSTVESKNPASVFEQCRTRRKAARRDRLRPIKRQIGRTCGTKSDSVSRPKTLVFSDMKAHKSHFEFFTILGGLLTGCSHDPGQGRMSTNSLAIPPLLSGGKLVQPEARFRLLRKCVSIGLT